jgi:hypothetical protein
MASKPTAGLINPYLEMSKLLGVEDAKLIKMADPYEFIFKYAYTLDPHDSVNPIKKFPEHPYIRCLIKEWLENHSLIVVKSRQMMASWLFVALNLWLAMTQSGQYIFFISKKEDDAGWSSSLSLLSRAMFIHSHLPKEMQSVYKKSTQPAILNFVKKNSSIHGVSQDSEAVRQYTSSSVLCVHPKTKVLNSDLYWINAGEVKAGDTLVGFEENSGNSGFKSNGEGRARKWKNSLVLNVSRAKLPCYKLFFSDGTEIVCSAKHKWLKGYSQKWSWITTDRLRARGCSEYKGQGWAGSKVIRLSDVWGEDRSYEAGYLSAAFDGEGCFRQDDRKDLDKKNMLNFSFSQNDNKMLVEVKRLLKEKDFTPMLLERREERYSTIHTVLSLCRKIECMRFLGQIRPKRLLEKLNIDDWGMAKAKCGVELLKKEFLGVQEVVGFITSTGTFLAEGLASHNCDEMAFQENSEKVFAALKPTLDGRKTKIKCGRDMFISLPKLVGVSTPNGKRNLFYKLVHDVKE